MERTFRLRRAVQGGAAVALVAGAAVFASVGSAGAASTGLVINEVYGGGGNSGATLTNDFIEILNEGSQSVDLSGDSVQYHAASGTGAWQKTDLTGTVAPGGIYLVDEAKGSGGTDPGPAAQDTGTIAMAAGAGTVALVGNQTLLTCQSSTACGGSPTVDLVGYGTTAINETGPAPALGNSTSDARPAPAKDTDDNASDFVAGTPTPGAPNAGGGTGTGTGTPGPLRIHDLQGSSFVSPQDGKAVVNVPGIVTAIRNSGSSRGYWIQDPNPDSNPATSEGIFVFTSAPNVAVGDSVLVSGTVKDYYPLGSGETVSTTSNLSTTEIDNPTAVVLSHGNPLPAPIVITPTTLPNSYAPNLGGGNIESTPIQPTRSALDFWESVEGMRVEVDNARVVGPSDAYGEQYITTKPTQDATPRGGNVLLGENAVPSGRVEVVPTDGSNPEVNVGDTFTGATVGPVDYSQYGGYVIAATQLGTVKSGGLKPTVATPQTKQQLAVATYNVENLAATDPQSKFDALAKGIVTNLSDPDIIALEEIQDNDGATDDGVVASDETVAKLTAAITAAGGPKYASQGIDPVNDQDGGEPGGNIRQVFLYNPATVSFISSGGKKVNRATTGTQVVKGLGGAALTLSPGRIDPTSPVWTASRKPLVGEFEATHGRGVRPLFVIANHFDAKLGDQSDDGRFQFPAQSSAIQRAGQAAVEHRFVQQLLDVDRKAEVVVVGDLNDYPFSPAVHTLVTGSADATGTPILTDLINTLPANQRYTYDFDGVSEVLDHILTTAGVKQPVYQVVHINAEFAHQTSDHDPQVVRFKP